MNERLLEVYTSSMDFVDGSIAPRTYEIFINVSHSSTFTIKFFNIINKNKSSAEINESNISLSVY